MPVSFIRRTWVGLAAPFLLAAVLVSLAAFAPSGALPASQQNAAEKSARQVIDEAVARVFEILRDPALKKDPEQRMRQLRQAVDPAFDWEAMAQSSLGHEWRKLGEQERSDFVTVFKELLAREYMDDIDRFQGTERVLVKAAEESGELVIVRTVLITNSREQVPIDYTLHLAAGRWRVEDISIEHVSLVNHYRKTFSRFLVNKSFAELLAQLKRKLGIT